LLQPNYTLINPLPPGRSCTSGVTRSWGRWRGTTGECGGQTSHAHSASSSPHGWWWVDTCLGLRINKLATYI